MSQASYSNASQLPKEMEKCVGEGRIIHTDPDTNQWVQRLDDGRFRVYDQDIHGEGHVNVFAPRSKSDEELDDIVDGYYPSIERVREVYGDDNTWGPGWPMVVAEIQSEKKVIHSPKG